MSKKFVKYLPGGDLLSLQRQSGVKVTSEPVSRSFAAACALVSVIGIVLVIAEKLRRR